ncbi:MAG: methyltransferase domain-containing protein, partial [Bermanella sp.]
MSAHIAKDAIAKSFSKAASEYDEYARIQHVLAHELLTLCPRQDKKNVLDLGCGTGYCLPALQEIYPRAHITGGDLAVGMLQHAQSQHPQFAYEI